MIDSDIYLSYVSMISKKIYYQKIIYFFSVKFLLILKYLETSHTSINDFYVRCRHKINNFLYHPNKMHCDFKKKNLFEKIMISTVTNVLFMQVIENYYVQLYGLLYERFFRFLFIIFLPFCML